ncbi:MAG: hypothetical protein HY747_01595 [Elusimicrobia bacterium]|nr:hypothetical protein [Elusimicrobiota bacterium]
MGAYWHDLVTEKSWQVLTGLQSSYRFTLIGGWAIFLYSKSLKSKDIDLVIDYDELAKLQKQYPVVKNERLKKYEAKNQEIDIDIYAPYYSNPGIPAEELPKLATALEGFSVPKPEALLILKQQAYSQRQASPKGEKDRLDILSLLKSREIDWHLYRKLAGRFRIKAAEELTALLHGVTQAVEIGLRSHEMSRLKKKWLAGLKSSV